MLQDSYQLMNRESKKSELYRMRRVINNPAIMYRKGAIDETMLGLVTAKSESFDNIFIEITSFILIRVYSKTLQAQ